MPLVVLAAACGSRKPVITAPVVTTPKYPDFIRPTVPAMYANTPAAEGQARGWAFLQYGDLKNAEREFTAAFKMQPGFYPAETSLGYVDLARNDAKAALPRFDHALQTHANDVPSLVGRGQALVALERDDEALTAFEAAVNVDPSLTELSRRIEVMRFRGAEQTVARARQAARGGQLDEAIRLYGSALSHSPDSPFLYRELAAVERLKGQTDDALTHFRKAVSLDPSDGRSVAQIGELLEARGDFDGAELAYATAQLLEPSADLDRRLTEIRARAAVARLPAEYRAIDQALQITRGDLAALIGIRLAPLLEGSRRTDTALMTDVRNHWATTWIMAVAGAGVIEPFANHAFQPRSVVRRTDLAQAVGRLLPRAAARVPNQPKPWESARLRFSDLSPTHLAYPAASAAVASGAMKVVDNAFQPSRAVTGAEAIEAVTRIGALAGLK